MISVKNLKLFLYISLYIFLSAEINAQDIWNQIDTNKYELNTTNLNTILTSVSKENNSTAYIDFPSQDGELKTFIFSDNTLLPPSLSRKYPNIHSYKGVSIEDSQLSVTLTCSTSSVSAVIINGTNVWSLQQINNTNIYQVTNDDDSLNTKINCENIENDNLTNTKSNLKLLTNNTTNKTLIGDNTLRTLRTAIVVTGEYSNYFVNKANLGLSSEQDKKAIVLSGIVTSLNNLNTVFERDLGIRFELVENNDELIFLDQDTDIFTTDDSNDLINTGSQYIIDTVGLDNFDIGHVLSIGFAGLAEVGALCGTRKAEAVSAGPIPEGTEFDFTLFAHEIGHQLGANHTQNSNCNRSNSGSAVEPGSGSTIMGYAGVCGISNSEIQNISDEYFHLVSIYQVKNHLESISCTLPSSTIINSNPIIEPLTDYTIPASTPFVLDALVTDLENDPLTYCWEQMDSESATMPPVSTSTVGPLFRSIIPTNESSRNFPENFNINTTWEVLPSVSRTMNFGLTVRDGNAGGIATSELTVNVIDTGKIFEITSPSTGDNFVENANEEIQWNVAGTNENGINTENVSILLSYDNGETYPVVLAENTPNDGNHIVQIPSGILSNTVRVKISAIDNIYYTISNNTFEIYKEIIRNTDNEILPIPNPVVNDTFDIKINLIKVSSFLYELYSMNGSLEKSGTSNSDVKTIDVSKLSTGVYLLKIIIGTSIQTKTLVII